MKPWLVTPDNVLALVPVLLHLAPAALRPSFRKTYGQYRADLERALVAYQLAQQISLPPGQPALQTRWNRMATLVRYANAFIALLTEEMLQHLEKALSKGDGLRALSK